MSKVNEVILYYNKKKNIRCVFKGATEGTPPWIFQILKERALTFTTATEKEKCKVQLVIFIKNFVGYKTTPPKSSAIWSRIRRFPQRSYSLWRFPIFPVQSFCWPCKAQLVQSARWTGKVQLDLTNNYINHFPETKQHPQVLVHLVHYKGIFIISSPVHLVNMQNSSGPVPLNFNFNVTCWTSPRWCSWGSSGGCIKIFTKLVDN